MCQPQLGDAAGEGEGGIFVACVHVRVHAPFSSGGLVLLCANKSSRGYQDSDPAE